MSNLTKILNQDRELVQVTRMVVPFDDKIGPIPEVVPVLRADGRAFAGGRVVLGERLDALRSKNPSKIAAWGNNYFDLADACITFEDLLKAQPDSPLLKGIRGVVTTSDGLYVAVDAEAVSRATKNMKHFQVRDSEIVTYGLEDNKISQPVSVNDVVLFKYNKPYDIELTPDQFGLIDAKLLKRHDFIYNRDMEQEEIVNDKKVIHPVYKNLYPTKWVVSLVSKTFEFNKKEYNYDANMGIYLAEPQSKAKIRAFYAYGLGEGAGLCGDNGLGGDSSRLVGVVEKSAVGVAKK
jgi:hypothetical protein